MKKIRILAFFAALATALGVYLFFSSVNKPSKIVRTTVVVAAKDIKANTTITGDMVTVSEIETEAVLPNAVRDLPLAVGAVMKTDAVVGEQILSDRLIKAGKTDSQTLAYSITPGMRAITIAVDNTKGLSGLIKPENRIDLIAQFQVDAQAEKSASSSAVKNTPMSKILLQNIKVLATDQTLSKDAKTNSSGYSAITLEVTPQQAVELSFAAKNASLQAILRSPIDNKQVEVPHITQQDVIGK
ncbi:MAG TPA: Flp pilus assembly protein CpaB [Caproiciproducens sp.]|nr:Flp pilus assembly protein CpaB [Caproiciproducens sp.]